jgi:hypothetical protein
VSQPSANSVDIHSASEQVTCGRMSTI